MLPLLNLYNNIFTYNFALFRNDIPLYYFFLVSREKSEVAGFFVFSHIQMMGYVMIKDCPEGLNTPLGLSIGEKLL